MTVASPLICPILPDSAFYPATQCSETTTSNVSLENVGLEIVPEVMTKRAIRRCVPKFHGPGETGYCSNFARRLRSPCGS